jgi:hypothetical protein
MGFVERCTGLSHAGAETAALQKRGYPGLAPLSLALAPEQAFPIALAPEQAFPIALGPLRR